MSMRSVVAGTFVSGFPRGSRVRQPAPTSVASGQIKCWCFSRLFLVLGGGVSAARRMNPWTLSDFDPWRLPAPNDSQLATICVTNATGHMSLPP